MDRLEKEIRKLTTPINGQYPRPWVSELDDPLEANVFIVGYNPATKFSVEAVGKHDRFVEAMFNRNGESGRTLYNEVRNRSSQTRSNSDLLVDRLATAGVRKILQTNVVCYSTPTINDLDKPQHKGGRERGEKIFMSILSLIRPRVIIAHGVETNEVLSRLLEAEIPRPPVAKTSLVRITAKGIRIFPIPTLSPRRYHSWETWRDDYLDKLVAETAAIGLAPE